MTPKFILASSSPFRQSLLNKFNISFISTSPDISETAKVGESAETLVLRLALAKAKAVSENKSEGIIIGSDQVAVHQNNIIGKPHSKPIAIKQLSQFSGQKVTFFTGLAIYNAKTKQSQSCLVPYTVYFKKLTLKQITAYLEAEQPYNCAGSFKSEGLGICLFDKLEGDDPNALIGLPLIALNKLLLEWDIDILALQK